MGIKVDFSEFEAGLKEAYARARSAGGVGLFEAANELLEDAITVRPLAPFDEGHLRGSARTKKAKYFMQQVEVDAGFNIEYAARWHEISPEKEKRVHWTLPGSGRKYLELKLTMFGKKYMAIVAEAIRRAMRK